MEFQFLDLKLNVDLTNLIASFVGPKNNKFVKKINKKYEQVKNNIYDQILQSNLNEYEEYLNINDIDVITEEEFNQLVEEEFILEFQKQYSQNYQEKRQERLREIEILKSINWNDDDSISFIYE
jgi:hypothetical protein